MKYKTLFGQSNPAKRLEVRKKLSICKIGIKNPNSSIWHLYDIKNNRKIIINGGIKRNLLKYGLTYSKLKHKYSDTELRSTKDKNWKLDKINK